VKWFRPRKAGDLPRQPHVRLGEGRVPADDAAKGSA